MEFNEYLQFMVAKDASDIYLSTAAPPSAKIHGQLMPIEPDPLPNDRVKEIA